MYEIIKRGLAAMINNLISQDERYLFAEGTWLKAYEKLGAHPAEIDGQRGYIFAVWAPMARNVRVLGDFNGWDMNSGWLEPDESGIWTIFVPGAKQYDNYKYCIETRWGDLKYKADPYAFHAETRPGTASKLYDIGGFEWGDSKWMNNRAKNGFVNRPLNIYEVNLGSWRRHDDGTYLSYSELADTLVPYAADMGYTHLELMPVMEHPFDGSWGYQITGYYAPTSRFGTPHDLMHFVDAAHRAGLGVILDWVPGHFCPDDHGLSYFTGEKLYEKEKHPNWGTYKFDLGRGEVKSFLSSNAHYWVDMYHADGIRVDGVTSMLYLNFGVDDPRLKKFNRYGDEGDLDAIEYIRGLNKSMGIHHPDVMMMAEESTAWPLVTYPPEDGGLGFNYKWNMGWMHDTLHYMQADFPYRPGAHHLLTFSMMYAFSENFVLALSHDEVVHGKCSIIGRMPGDYWRQFAGMRVLYLYQITHPGAKLNFMGSEFAQFIEWREYEGLQWFLPDNYTAHKAQLDYVKALNHVYTKEKALWQVDNSWDGYTWLDADNNKQSMLAFIRKGKKQEDDLVVLLNFCPETYQDYRVGVPRKGDWQVIFNSDDPQWGGSGMHGTPGILKSEKEPFHGQKNSVTVNIPPIGGIILKRIPTPKTAAPKKKD